jgi:ATP-binding cassette subfamily F protein uup
MEGKGQAVVYAGGWSDYRAQRSAAQEKEQGGARGTRDGDSPKTKSSGPKSAPTGKGASAKSGLSFTEKHRLEALPAEIARLEAEIAKLQELMSDPGLFTENPVKFQKATDALIERQARLDSSEEEWLTLEEKAQS